jgi:hypothetical protein
MAFPALDPIGGGVLHSEKTGVPVNGNNTFAHNIAPELIDNPDWLNIDVYLNGTVTNASGGTLSPDKTEITVNFTQTGGDSCRVVARYIHSVVR